MDIILHSPLTRHGRRRMAERGIHPGALALLLAWGDDIPAARGCVLRGLRAPTMAELLADGVPLVLVEAAARLEAVVGVDGAIVTTYARDPRALRRAVRRKRRRGRRS